jgi:hypothetical protein
VPQTEPLLQLELLKLLPNEAELPPESREANVEIFLVTFWLWQAGQVTSLTLLALNTSSSNGLPHSAHTNSKMGMVNSYALLDTGYYAVSSIL